MKVFVRKINSSNRKSNYKDNWRVITEHKTNGKIARKQIKTFKTKDEAEAFAKDHEKSIRIGRDYDFDMSLQEFYDNHIINWAYSHYKTTRSAKQILSMLDRFVLPRVGHKQLDKISINDWEQLYTTGDVFKILEWHDSYVFWHLSKIYRSEKNILVNDIGYQKGVKGHHVFVNSELALYMDHFKGKRKLQGTSARNDFRANSKSPVDINKIDYWKKVPPS